jgi:hypothetical protein
MQLAVLRFRTDAFKELEIIGAPTRAGDLATPIESSGHDRKRPALFGRSQPRTPSVP